MKPINIKRFPWCCTTNLQLARQGELCRRAFRDVQLPTDSPLRVIQSAINMPVGDGFFSALLLNLTIPKEDDSPYLRIKSHQRRHRRSGYSIIVPNFTTTLDKRALTAFARSDADGLMKNITNFIPAEILPCRSTWSDFLSALDASTLGMGYPASLISYLNFVDDFAVPSDTKKTNQAKSLTNRALKKYHSIVGEILSGKCLESDFNQRCQQEIERGGEKESDLIRIAIFYAFDFTRNRKSYESFDRGKIAAGSDRTYLMEIPRAYELLSEGILRGRLDGPLMTVIKIIRHSNIIENEHPNSALIIAQGRELIPSYVDLWTPQELDQALEYPLKLNTQETSEISEMELAQSMIKILLRNGLVRFDALLKVQLSDFKYSGNLIEWRIRESKNKILDLPFPLSSLTPEPACTFFRAAWHKLISKHGGMALLLELSGITIDTVFKNVTHADWSSTMSRETRSHIGRITAISWLPLRVLSLHYPDVLQHPAIADIVKHEWFSPIELEKLRILFPSPSVDTVEVIRLLVGWEDKQQFFHSYLRINHLLLLIHRDIILNQHRY